MFEGRKVSDRIVSIDAPYVHPIVRERETSLLSSVQKVNNIQIDGISFIEHLSFKAFNEGIRLKDCIRMQQKLMNVRVRCVAADAILRQQSQQRVLHEIRNIHFPSCARKGGKDEQLRRVLRSELSRRGLPGLKAASAQKQHYSLSRIKARNRKTEILWIFFGIHTANAVLMIDKIRNRTVSGGMI